MAFRTNKMPVLQEKSASGAVATFNTALAMPLVNGEFTIQAYQEGSGDPSPFNKRNIVPFNTQKIIKAGKNLIDVSKNIIGAYINSIGGETTAGAQNWAISDYIPVAKGGVYTFNPNTTEGISAKGAFYDENKQYLPNSVFNSGAITITAPTNAFYVRFSMRTTSYDVQLEAGSTATDYEPYVTPTIYTIQLGQEVYGAEVDVVNGVAHVTHYGMALDGTEDINKNTTYHYLTIPCTYNHLLNYQTGCISSHYVFGGTNKPRFSMGNLASVIWFFPEYDSPFYDNAEAFKSYLAQEYANNTPVQIMYPLAEPFDIQLSDIPTLSTIIGNNTIFADTGDVDLTYKDLDIAKRGNFREVFRLPS